MTPLVFLVVKQIHPAALTLKDHKRIAQLKHVLVRMIYHCLSIVDSAKT